MTAYHTNNDAITHYDENNLVEVKSIDDVRKFDGYKHLSRNTRLYIESIVHTYKNVKFFTDGKSYTIQWNNADSGFNKVSVKELSTNEREQKIKELKEDFNKVNTYFTEISNYMDKLSSEFDKFIIKTYFFKDSIINDKDCAIQEKP